MEWEAMLQSGRPILAGTDAGTDLRRCVPGFALHGHLAALVQKGLTPIEALCTATLNPAKCLKGTDSLGSVTPGKLADLVFLEGDLLADIICARRWACSWNTG